MKKSQKKKTYLTIISCAREIKPIKAQKKHRETSMLEKYFFGLKGVGAKANAIYSSFSRLREYGQSSRLNLQSESAQSFCENSGDYRKRG